MKRSRGQLMLHLLENKRTKVKTPDNYKGKNEFIIFLNTVLNN